MNILILSNFIKSGTFENPNRVTPGMKELRTSNGDKVNRLDKGKYGRWTRKTGQGAKLYVRLLKGGTDYGKNQKKAQPAV
jgi:hypothetical protein